MICARLTEDYRIEEFEKNRTPFPFGEDVFRRGIHHRGTDRTTAGNDQGPTRKPWNRTTAKKSVPTAPVPSGNQKNRQTVIERVEMETGIQLESISGGEEAQFFTACRAACDGSSKGRLMLADLGGGVLR
ncbi:MAG: hypothetical protein Ct9H90mP9_3690 [Pseudomonadota bacterium]|nr:MAG: hypothetical protein Ct9H90mP9_3690 [Pseudomonadota bacterium]